MLYADSPKDQVGAAADCCPKASIFYLGGFMLSVEKAREIILAHIKVLQAERVSLETSLGRYLAEDIISTLAIPPCDNSAMDGYAVRTQDITAYGVTLKVSSILPAGASDHRRRQDNSRRQTCR